MAAATITQPVRAINSQTHLGKGSPPFFSSDEGLPLVVDGVPDVVVLVADVPEVVVPVFVPEVVVLVAEVLLVPVVLEVPLLVLEDPLLGFGHPNLVKYPSSTYDTSVPGSALNTTLMLERSSSLISTSVWNESGL